MQFINVQVQYFGETQDRDFQITKKINIWRFMLFEIIIIRETSEKIWEQANKVDSEEAVRQSVALLYSRLLTIDWFGWESRGNLICLATSNYVCIDF